MNLYNLHSDPQSLLYFEEVPEIVPDLFWDKYKNNPEELKKREREISKYAEYSYYYARGVLEGPFPLGEAAIAKRGVYAYYYARFVLKDPFPAGEAAIATNPGCALAYATTVLKADFYINGKLIAKFEK